MTFLQNLVQKSFDLAILPAAKKTDLAVAVAVPYTQVVTANAIAAASVATENTVKAIGNRAATLFERASKQLADAKKRVAEAQGENTVFVERFES